MDIPGLPEFEREVLERLVKIESKLDEINTLRVTAGDNRSEITKNRESLISLKKDTDEQERRITDLENGNKWLWRTVAGAVITALIGIAFTFIQIGMRL